MLSELAVWRYFVFRRLFPDTLDHRRSSTAQMVRTLKQSIPSELVHFPPTESPSLLAATRLPRVERMLRFSALGHS